MERKISRYGLQMSNLAKTWQRHSSQYSGLQNNFAYFQSKVSHAAMAILQYRRGECHAVKDAVPLIGKVWRTFKPDAACSASRYCSIMLYFHCFSKPFQYPFN
jgi:hypothetical protein